MYQLPYIFRPDREPLWMGYGHLSTVPREVAFEFIRRHHGTHAIPNGRGLLCCLGLLKEERVVAVATLNSPTGSWVQRDPRKVVEVTRVASDGTVKGSSSQLVSQAIDLCGKLGRPLLVTYSLVGQRGSAYRGLREKGLRPVGVVRDKVRWEAGEGALPADWSCLDHSPAPRAPQRPPEARTLPTVAMEVSRGCMGRPGALELRGLRGLEGGGVVSVVMMELVLRGLSTVEGYEVEGRVYGLETLGQSLQELSFDFQTRKVGWLGFPLRLAFGDWQDWVKKNGYKEEVEELVGALEGYRYPVRILKIPSTF